MNRSTYLAHPDVRAFIDWAAPLVTGKRKLMHSWHSPKLGRFSCQSIWAAYQSYSWNGQGFDEMVECLGEYGHVLRNTDDGDRFLSTAKEVMKWGGINNEKGLSRLGNQALPVLRNNAIMLDPKRAETDDLTGLQYMGAGYSKVYSLMIDGFPMYDSRVACALTSLISLHRKENSLTSVPEQLRLGTLPQHRSKEDRSPPGFPRIRYDPASKVRYADSNLKAAWLIGALADLGEFGTLPAERRVWALQSALFMIGYKPLVTDTQAKFERLASEWKHETAHLSSPDMIAEHRAYQEIIGMGKEAIPLILRDLEDSQAQWFWALRSIARESPVRPEDRGDVHAMTVAWLDWGKDRRHI